MASTRNRLLAENLTYLAKQINVDKVVSKTKEMYPAVITPEQVVALNTRKREARTLYLLDIFKGKTDGYDMLYNVLKATNHSSTVLKILEPGVETPVTLLPTSPSKPSNGDQVPTYPAKPSDGDQVPTSSAKPSDKDQAYLLALEKITKDFQTGQQQTSEQISNLRSDIQSGQDKMAAQISSIKSDLVNEITGLRNAMDRIGNLEEALKLETMSREELKKVVQTVLKELTTYKEEHRKTAEKIDKLEKRGSSEDEILNKFIDQLKDISTLGEEKLWQEIVKLKQEMASLRKWSKENCGKMQTRLNAIEQERKVRTQSHLIQETDIQFIAVKIGTYWEVVAKEVGIQKDTVAKTGSEATTAASDMMSRWLELSKTGRVAPPTWESLDEIIGRHDRQVASEIEKLRKSTDNK